MPDDATAGLIFASDQANHNFARVLGDLRRAHLSVAHRLRSIRRDAAFVAAVAARYPGLALVANERCGSWYIPSSAAAAAGVQKSGSAYFKSTDGHTGQWSFSMRRLNLHLLPLLSAPPNTTTTTATTGGILLVDSTRRGKRMPDALSKTVPLWCCVLNRALFPADGGEDGGDGGGGGGGHHLYTPPGVVSASEHSQMLARVPAFVEGLHRLGVLAPDPVAWRRIHLPNAKPLRPVWVTPDMPWPDVGGLAARFNVVLCCTCSHAPSSAATAAAAAAAGAGSGAYPPDYVQGAADDTENWAHGLTPALFWAHCDELLRTPEAELPARIAALVQAGAEDSSAAVAAAAAAAAATGSGNSPLGPGGCETEITPRLAAGQWTGPAPPAPAAADAHVCQIVFVRQAATSPDAWVRSPTSLEVGLGKQDKTAGRTLRYALPTICAFVSAFLAAAAAEPHSGSGAAKRVRVLCPTGRDVSVGTALALLCFCFDEAGAPRTTPPAIMNKDVIRMGLGRIMAAMPHANPSRATLQSVNSFLMDAHG